MPSLAIDPVAQGLRWTGAPIEPERAWGERDGRRVKTDSQAVDDHGRPLWPIEIAFFDPTEDFGAGATVVAKVLTPAAVKPVLTHDQPPPFEGLRVQIRRDGRQFWTAEGLRAEGSKPTGSASAAPGKAAG